ncbi:MAG: cytochrome c-type biosis protein CycH [Pseudomonadota bacterium]|jgi:cytochrome c-type biogenesis protein CcmH
MIGFWIGAALLTAIVMALLLRPLLKPPAQPVRPADYARKVYADQVAEIDRDLARGIIGADQAKAARVEVGRRLLATADRADSSTEGVGTGTGAAPVAPPAKRLATVVTLLLPLAALAVYIPLGQPHVPSLPFAQREAERPPVPEHVLRALGSLEQKLKEDPDDLQGWALAAATYAAMGRSGEAAQAYRRAVALSQGDPELVAAFGEQLTIAADGIVGEEAKRAFEAVMEKDPANPRAGFYLGIARQQAGDPRGAIDRWAALMRQSPADAPWVPLLRTQIFEVANLIGVDPFTVTPEPLPPTGNADGGTAGAAPSAPAAGAPAPGAPSPGPNAPAGPPEARAPLLSPEQMAQMAQLPPAEQQAMIRTMVDGLAARLDQQPDDLAGWLRLARARTVLGEQAAAEAALKRATEIAPDRADIWLTYAGALAPEMEGQPRRPEFLAAMTRVLELEPANPHALFHLGDEAAAKGDTATARTLWTRLRDTLPDGSPARADVDARLAALGG